MRKPTNVSLPTVLVAQATERGVNLSRACERGLADAAFAAPRREMGGVIGNIAAYRQEITRAIDVLLASF
jgi:hypothetical protein